MYRIIGADDKEYGPVPAERIRQWVQEGRLNRLTRVRPEGAPDWIAIGALSEFDELFPPLPQPSPKAAEDSIHYGLATAALVCGALGLVTCVTAPVGLTLGLVAQSRIRNSDGRLTGSNLATGGIVLSVIAMLLGLLAGPLLLPALMRVKGRPQEFTCKNHIRQLELAASMYSAANQGALPSAATWCDDITPFVGSPQTFHCPAGDVRQRCHYAFNAKLAAVSMIGITRPATTVMFFETDGGWNLSGGPELLRQAPRHGTAVVVGFADGHVETVAPNRLSKLNWEP